tara:strand:+ start:252 stop:728 length:477 start_codon:yes stop_codon:yes gene_type:complete
MKRIYFNSENLKNTHDIQDDEYFNVDNQLQYLLQFEKNEICDTSLNKLIKREIGKKISSYKSQDKKNGKYDEEKHISYQQLLEKLTSSQLKCYYCNSTLYLLYQKRGEPMQWSLERFDNNLGHYDSNTCISCLKCNLQRRTSNHEYFKFSKSLSITKI